ncbi:exodeoxyribonuclease VII large subunit [Pseudooceanicola sp. CBS1P-1]|uniref:Exodeoxyribonuclease 7 large subunit n=1 Tax=Pseudooceanicola albus TaxID=2692189 RepID=A0A6L7G3R5_9RHOB|nr:MULTISPECIES: exodeoxyribonuclease VII large subunit [Pseudooceanicola]MBT9385596.1 exodeoxyribonuclease VII large subunit [Pseudooceanicola endophyticus]MXN18994.1 exodeoxyribonuclease VII large subunit [Pseudooceanicola albus]
MDLFEDATPDNAPEFTVSEISGALKRMIEGEFSHVRIRGEIGRVSFPRSGHVYLDLKDDRSVISAVIWKGVASRLETAPEEGLEVVATGRLTTFPGQSKYQMVIEDMAPAGMGALMAMLEKRRAMLQAEGLFDPARKKPLPFLPEVIGVVTSPSGAVIRDILHRLRDRFPRKVLIWPAAVQGKNCAPEVARGIAGFNRMTPGGALPRPDLIIVARGGGSLEDLWGFNEEIVVRAAAASEIPLISAVGHETDTTLIDHAADRRAPTPTAAAELAVPVRADLLAWTAEQGARLTRAQMQALDARKRILRDLSRALPRPETLTETQSQRLDYLGQRLGSGLSGLVQRRKVALSEAGGALRPTVLSNRITRERRDLEALSNRLAPALARAVAVKQERLQTRADRLSPVRISERLARGQGDFDRLTRTLLRLGTQDLKAKRDRLEALERLRYSVGYEATLERGYAVVRDEAGHVLRSREEAARAGALEIEFADGRFSLTGGDVPPVPPSGTPPRKAPRRKEDPPAPEQGSLF